LALPHVETSYVFVFFFKNFETFMEPEQATGN